MMNNNNIMDFLVSGKKGGKGGGGGATRVAQEAPNTLQSKSLLRVVELISEGEILGLVDGAKSIKFDKTPLQNADGTYNFSGVNFELRSGTPDQDYIPGFANVEEEIPVGVKVTTTSAIVRTVTDLDTDAVRVTVRIPALTEQNTTNGDLNGSSVEFKLSYQPNGGSYITAVSGANATITGKTVTTYERQFLINLTGSGPWNIKMERITADNTAANIQNDIYFSSYTRIINHKLTYPDSALIALEVDSSLFGSSVPTRSYEIYGLIVKVPSNYNPTTRVYTGVWDGTFQLAWTDNPAWVLYDLITNKRYGLGQYIDESEVDKFSLYTIAQYCDELVDDGQGGTEPRFTFNYSIETQEDAVKVLQVVASVFRGMIYWGSEGSSGIITATHDAPRDAEKIYSRANVLGGLFTYSGTALDTRHSAVFVSWNDPNQDYAPRVEVVEDISLIERYGYRKTDVLAYGCTSRGQAHRFGKWILDSETNESEMVSFSVGLADADLRPGNIIKIADADYSNVEYGGRLISGTTTVILLDRAFVKESGKTYSIDVVMPDGTLESKSISTAVVSGSQTTVTLASALSVAPDANTMWVITSNDVAPRQFRVIGLKETRPTEFEVTAMYYDPNKFARVEQNINLPDSQFTKINSGVLETPSDIATFEYLFRNGALVQSAVTVAWKPSPDKRIVKYSLEVKKPGTGQNYELYRVDNGLSCDVKPTYDGVWSFRVRGYDALGNSTAYLVKENVTLNINSQPPSDVQNFNISTVGDSSQLSWDSVTDLNLSHYEIAFNANLTGAEWNNSVVIVKKASSSSTSVQIPSRSGTYLIKAVTLPTDDYPLGVYSENATLITTDIDSLINFNFVYEMIEDPAFDGAKTRSEVSGAGNLELTLGGDGNYPAVGYYNFESVYDLGSVFTCRLTPTIVASGNNIANLIDDWDNIDNILDFDGAADSQWSVKVQISTTNDEPAGFILLAGGGYLIQIDTGDLIELSDGGAEWSEWKDVQVSDYRFRAVHPRVVLYSNSPKVTPSIENLKLTIDMPDFLQVGSDIATSALDTSGTTVTFPYEFRNSDPAISISTQNMAVGDFYEILSKSATDFVIRFKNSGGSVIGRTFDYHAKGVGFVT